MKIGVIGLGVMGKHHVRVCKELGVLAAVFDINSNTAQKVGSEFGVEWFSELDQMLKLELDGAIIATPTASHRDDAIRCIDRGLHVFVEKPLSLTIEAAQEICDAVTAAGKVLATGYIERYNPAYLALKELVTVKEFGELTSINIKRVGGSPRSADNVIVDLMTHDFSLLLNLLENAPDRIYTNKHFNNGILDSAQVMLDFGTISATCEANWVSPTKIRQIHVTGTQGYCEVDLIKQQLKIISTNLNSNLRIKAFRDVVQTSAILDFQKEPLKAEIESFVDAIKTNKTSGVVSGTDALKVLELTIVAATHGEEHDIRKCSFRK
jgi:UDP-N-acetylglucosamine 3-dehydrogenase